MKCISDLCAVVMTIRCTVSSCMHLMILGRVLLKPESETIAFGF